MTLKQDASCPRKTLVEQKLCRTQEELGDPRRQHIQIYPELILFYCHVGKDSLSAL